MKNKNIAIAVRLSPNGTLTASAGSNGFLTDIVIARHDPSSSSTAWHVQAKANTDIWSLDEHVTAQDTPEFRSKLANLAKAIAELQ